MVMPMPIAVPRLADVFSGVETAYSRYWGHGCVFQVIFSGKGHFVCLYSLNRCHF